MRTMSDDEFQSVLAVLSRYEHALRAVPGVVDVGIGFKQIGEEHTEDAAIVVKVQDKQSAGDIAEELIIPEEIDGVRTDVRQTRLRLHLGPKDRLPSLTGGISIKNTHRRGMGTLGAVVFD